MKASLITFLLMSSSLFGQSLNVTLIDDTIRAMTAGTEYIISDLENTGNDTIEVDIIRAVNNIPPGWQTGLCVDGVCQFATVDSMRISIAPLATKEFRMYFQTLGSPTDTASTEILFKNIGDALNVFDQQYYAFLSPTASVPTLEGSKTKKLVKIVDATGREVEDKPNTLLFYIYDDGTSEKVFRME